mmetsp:Transcript_546/g.1221  ORF Transcript_546/g.1221 Transcript_546/m.1221 type:complete len:241 (-) Transcript_546:71-793(-)
MRWGLMYCCVPTKDDICSSVACSCLLCPRSVTLTSPFLFNRMFPGFRSLWARCHCEWRNANTSTSCDTTDPTTLSGMGRPGRMWSLSDKPSMNSVATTTRWFGASYVHPYSAQMPGCVPTGPFQASLMPCMTGWMSCAFGIGITSTLNTHSNPDPPCRARYTSPLECGGGGRCSPCSNPVQSTGSWKHCGTTPPPPSTSIAISPPDSDSERSSLCPPSTTPLLSVRDSHSPPPPTRIALP